jgi:hypothetical protein
MASLRRSLSRRSLRLTSFVIVLRHGYGALACPGTSWVFRAPARAKGRLELGVARRDMNVQERDAASPKAATSSHPGPLLKRRLAGSWRGLFARTAAGARSLFKNRPASLALHSPLHLVLRILSPRPQSFWLSQRPSATSRNGQRLSGARLGLLSILHLSLPLRWLLSSPLLHTRSARCWLRRSWSARTVPCHRPRYPRCFLASSVPNSSVFQFSSRPTCVDQQGRRTQHLLQY